MLTATIPSYLYQQYADDVDLQAFVASYNVLAQEYVDWFSTISLPVYTGPLIEGSLLDWVAEGLYGIRRPTLSGTTVVDDDVFKRVISWHFFKGDGQVFNIRWLKRRVMRFLEGTDGTDPGVNQTYQISVWFSGTNTVNINVLGGIAVVTGGLLFNAAQYNTKQYNQLDLNITQYVDTTLAQTLKEAIDAGVLELPFQFEWVVGVPP